LKNQIRVHLWYESKIGFQLNPYLSIEEAIESWPTTATALAVHHSGKVQIKICLEVSDFKGQRDRYIVPKEIGPRNLSLRPRQENWKPKVKSN
jgi:hypothetical protein